MLRKITFCFQRTAHLLSSMAQSDWTIWVSERVKLIICSAFLASKVHKYTIWMKTSSFLPNQDAFWVWRDSSIFRSSPHLGSLRKTPCTGHAIVCDTMKGRFPLFYLKDGSESANVDGRGRAKGPQRELRERQKPGRRPTRMPCQDHHLHCRTWHYGCQCKRNREMG